MHRVDSVENAGHARPAFTISSSPQEDDQTKGEAMRFEIMRLDDVDGTPVDSTVVDAASVNRIVQQAAATGQRLWIRPAETTAS
ncbi:hypothetical protein GCM10010344_21110 [Streptomyces bluensis]|nr:hypothetical protein GCM10010344_21110 [Streptomyces bluensis]